MRSGILRPTCLLLLLLSGRPAAAQDWMVRTEVDGRPIEGTALSWNEQRVRLLARDGQLWDFQPTAAKNSALIQQPFRSYNQGEMRARLSQEFGRSYQVSGTGHYLVVHPAGQRDRWAPRFEQVYRAFLHYFRTRGLQLDELQFPLVAVAFPTRSEFDQYAVRTGERLPARYVGYYSRRSNRVLFYDRSGEPGIADAGLSTIVHEVAHQAAFNTGVQRRFAGTPRWVTEGLGTLFEAPGIWDGRRQRDLGHRVNDGRLRTFRLWLPQRPRGTLAQIVASDRMFNTRSAEAYAEAWALTFYLAEREGRKYARYLQASARYGPFTAPTGPQRLEDFCTVFGEDLALLEARYLRFLESLSP